MNAERAAYHELCASALCLVAFTFITGFSIGAAYIPAALAMAPAAGFAAAGRLS